MISPNGRNGRIRGLLTPRRTSRLTITHRDGVERGKAFIAWIVQETEFDVTDRCRCDEHVWARRVVATALRRWGLSFPAIGAALGRDHTSVIEMLRKADIEITDAAMQLECEWRDSRETA